jgi:hypothetical protein
MISENEVLKTVRGPKGEQVLRERRKLRTEKLHNLCSSPNVTVTELRAYEEDQKFYRLRADKNA